MSDIEPRWWAVQIVLLAAAAFLVYLTSVLDEAGRSHFRQLAEAEDASRSAVRTDGLLKDRFRYRFTNALLLLAAVTTGSVLSWRLPAGPTRNHVLAVVIYAVVFAVFAAAIPRLAASRSEPDAALRISGIQTVLDTVLTPLTWLLSLPAKGILTLSGRKPASEQSDEDLADDVLQILDDGHSNEEIKEEGRKMIGSIFRFNDERAYEIMTARTDVFMIDVADPRESYMDDVMQLRFTRVPVCEGDPDNIIGILNVKDLLVKAWADGFDSLDIREVLREAYFVPDAKNIATLFLEMQQKKQHIAVLIDEYGGFSGIVTIEDIIEEIVGDIDDEYDVEDAFIDQIDENTWLMSGNVELDDVNQETGADLSSENNETIGGLIIDVLGEIPKEGFVNQVVRAGRYEFTILSVHERRIEKVRMRILSDEELKDEEPENE